MNLRPLPMYDTLAEKLANQENFLITTDYKNRLNFTLSNLDPSRANQVAILLIHFYFLTNPNLNPFVLTKSTSRNSLPYDIKMSSSGSKGCSFDLDQLSPQFQAILGMYCCI
jgi:hypothetical protein